MIYRFKGLQSLEINLLECCILDIDLLELALINVDDLALRKSKTLALREK